MSRVFLARDTADENRELVLKKLVLTTDPDEIRDFLYSFGQEFKILSGLHHPNIPRAFDYFQESQDFYLVEEFIPGETLHIPPGGLKPHGAVKVILQICDLLEYLHKHNIVYRDLKPENIILDDSEGVHLVDFGISRFFSPDKEDDTVPLGTPGYAPPEAYKAPQTDERSDIYCMCALLHQLLTGNDPRANPFKFDPPHKVKSSIPNELSDLVMKGLSLDPESRFRNIDEFRGALFHTGGFDKKFKSYQKRLDRRVDFNEKEKPEGEFSKYRRIEFNVTLKDLVFAVGLSFAAAFIGRFAYPHGGILFAGLIFLVTGGGIILAGQLGQKQVRSIKIYPSGISYQGNEGEFSCLWTDVYALKLNLSKKYREITVVTLNGDFTYSENLEGWDQLMKEIQYRAGLKIRHDISGRYPELEIYERT